MAPVSQAEALDRLRAFAAGRGLVVEAVLDGDDWPAERPLPRVYGAPDGFPGGHWVAYATGRDALLLRSSEVLAVSKGSGEVRHLGDAGDEG